jgi:hypothetical protein
MDGKCRANGAENISGSPVFYKQVAPTELGGIIAVQDFFESKTIRRRLT